MLLKASDSARPLRLFFSKHESRRSSATALASSGTLNVAPSPFTSRILAVRTLSPRGRPTLLPELIANLQPAQHNTLSPDRASISMNQEAGAIPHEIVRTL